MKKVRILILILVLLLAGVLVWWIIQPKDFFYAGTIEATEIDVAARVASVIARYQVQEGDTVRAGQTLLTLTGEDLKLALRLAEREFQRGEKLLNSGSLTQAMFDQLRFKRDQAALLVSWCTIKAPAAGKVLNIYREAGEMVSPGMNLLTLGKLDEVWAMIYVEQPMLARLSAGMQVTGILPELPGHNFPGRIGLIKDEAEFTPKNVQTRSERSRLVYGIKILLPNPDGWLKPGMTIEMKLPEP